MRCKFHDVWIYILIFDDSNSDASYIQINILNWSECIYAYNQIKLNQLHPLNFKIMVQASGSNVVIDKRILIDDMIVRGTYIFSSDPP